MKKTLCLILALVMIASCLCGCGKKDDDNVLRVAMECAYAPYNWTQSDDSNGAVPIEGTDSYAYGYDVMWAKKIAEALNKELVIVKSDWDSLVPGIQSGAFDLVIAGQSPTPERAAVVDFTIPYYYASIVVLVKADSPYASATSVADLDGAVCTSQIGTIWYDTCLPQIPNAEIQPAQETAPAMLIALDSGAVDIVVTDQPTGLAALEAYDGFVMLEFPIDEGGFQVTQEDINICMSVQKGNTELADAINGILDDYTEEDYKNMMNEAILLQPVTED